MRYLPTGPNIQPKSLYNPSKADFTVTYANPNNEPIAYTLPSGVIRTYPTYIANHIAKHLAKQILNERGIETNYDDDLAHILQEIEVEV